MDLPAELATGRRILFIGDSFTTGLGNLGHATCDPSAAVSSLENSFLTYASLAASQLKADFQVGATYALRGKLLYRDSIPSEQENLSQLPKGLTLYIYVEGGLEGKMVQPYYIRQGLPNQNSHKI